MKDINEAREVTVINIPFNEEKPQQATVRLLQGLLLLGVRVVTLPVALLPPESRKHMEVAGREFTRGIASLAREIADSVERSAQNFGRDKNEPADKSKPPG